MMQVTYLPPGYRMEHPVPMPVNIDGWRKLLGGPIDVCECAGTVVPCVIVCLFQSGRVVSASRPNDIANVFVAFEPIFGPAILVAGASAVDALDDMFDGWEGDEPELPMVAR